VDGDRPVGFLMAFLDIDWRADGGSLIRSGLWRLNIAAGEQGKGYGRFAGDAVAEELRRRGTEEMYVTWHRSYSVSRSESWTHTCAGLRT
jgi:diamine N-acetyltransferase